MDVLLRDRAQIHCDALHYLIPFVRFKTREKHIWRSAKHHICSDTDLVINGCI